MHTRIAFALAHCQCIVRDYFAVYFARISFARVRLAVHASVCVCVCLYLCLCVVMAVRFHIKFLSLCHVYRRRRRRRRCAPNWLLFNGAATSVSWLAYPLHILALKLQCARPQPALAPLLLLCPQRGKILFIMSPLRQQLLWPSCFASQEICPIASLHVRADKGAWRDGQRCAAFIKRASAAACCRIKLPIYFLGWRPFLATLLAKIRNMQLINSFAFFMQPAPASTTLVRAKKVQNCAVRILMI